MFQGFTFSIGVLPAVRHFQAFKLDIGMASQWCFISIYSLIRIGMDGDMQQKVPSNVVAMATQRLK
eukprot:7138094-Lingulodinium_polyedra.AAC.1